MYKTSKIKVSIVCLLMCAVLCSGCGDSSDNIVYNTGTLEDGKEISDYYDLVGEATEKAFSGMNLSSAYVYAQQTSDGGWVAWSNDSNQYIYTESDVGADKIADKLGIKLVKPMEFK